MIFILLSFINLFIYYSKRKETIIKISENIIKSFLIICICILISTEILNYFNKIDFFFILLFWSLLSIILTLINIKNKSFIFFYLFYISEIKQKLLNKNNLIFFYKKNKILSWLYCWSILLLILSFIIGITYPPNGEDEIAYHLNRVYFWIAHKNINYYATNNVTNLVYPPFHNYCILQTQILTESIKFSFLFTYLHGLIILITIRKFISLLNLNLYNIYSYNNNLTFLLIFILPGFWLEINTTFNDIPVISFCLISVYFFVKNIKYNKFYIELPISIGLALLTKNIAYYYLVNIIIIYVILNIFRYYKNKKICYTWKLLFDFL